MVKRSILIVLLALFVVSVHSITNEEDVFGLNVFFSGLSSPSLSGWATVGGDPCAESWEGVVCDGPNVTQLNLAGLNLMGGLGYALDHLKSLVVMDLSNNNLNGYIPFQLPPNLQRLLLCGNRFIGALPYSVTYLRNLSFLNVSNNLLSENIPNNFDQTETLRGLDLSNNNLTGPLPPSLESLASLNTLRLENNHLSGTIYMLADLPLKDLDISNNNFTGLIPLLLASIPSFKYAGNHLKFSAGTALPPFSPSAPPFQVSGHKPPSNMGEAQVVGRPTRYLTGGHIAGIAIATVLTAVTVILLILFCTWKSTEHASKEEHGVGSPWWGLLPPLDPKGNPDRNREQKHKPVPPVITLKSHATVKYLNPKEKNMDGEVQIKNIKDSISAICYTVEELSKATNGFSRENLVGEGTSARVYMAKLQSEKILAVKKLDSSISMVHERDFLDILTSISRLRHANITELFGYCVEKGQRLLVYEYISNGTLHESLHFSEEKSRRLSWNLRIKIALGAARALEYLHEICQPTVVHRNLKSSNILLDDDFNPHLSDCGLASLTHFGSQCQFSSQHMGSFGYSAPEFAMSGMYSVRSDVYSFGVVMLELLTGRKPWDSSRPRAEQSLVRWAIPQLHDIDTLSKIVDPALKGMYPAKSLSRFADVIALCVQPEPEFRPSMSEVTQSLVKLLQRAGLNKRRSGEDLGSSQRILDAQELP